MTTTKNCFFALILGFATTFIACDYEGIHVNQNQTQETVPDSAQGTTILPQPAPVPPPEAPIPPPVASIPPLPAPTPPQAAPVQPPTAPDAPLPAPTPPPPVPPCFDRDLGDTNPCPGRTDCSTSSTVTSRTMCQKSEVTYVPACDVCEGVW
jgi:hypothetical protein